MGQEESVPAEEINAATCNSKLQSGKLYRVNLQFEGSTRSSLIFIPSTLSPSHLYPLVINFHGGGGCASQHMNSCLMNSCAERNKFIVVYPNGYGKVLSNKILTWNCTPGQCGPASKNNSKDVEFVLSVVQFLRAAFPFDENRLFCTGFSNGGMMCYRMASHPEGSKIVRAIAPVGGCSYYPAQFNDRPGFQPTKPMSILHIHSETDPRALYAGGEGPPFPLTNVKIPHPSVASVLQQWTEYNNCQFKQNPVKVNELAVVTPQGETHRATLWNFGAGIHGGSVFHWQLNGPGHVWPNKQPTRRARMMEKICGSPTNVIDANEEIWNFFKLF